MATDNEPPTTENLGDDSAAILQESIEPMRGPVRLAAAVGGTILIVMCTVALVQWMRGRGGSPNQ